MQCAGSRGDGNSCEDGRGVSGTQRCANAVGEVSSKSPRPSLLPCEDSPRGENTGDVNAILERAHSLDAGNPLVVPFGLLEAPSTPLVGNAEARPGLECPLLLHAADVASRGGSAPSSPTHGDYLKKASSGSLDGVRPASWWRKLLAFSGPGWLMSIAYVDPGNLEADLQCGAQFGNQLLWVLLWATGVGLGMQLVAARLGCVTRQHLAEHCRMHYEFGPRIFLWLLTELAIIGSDIQEVIGGAIGLQLLFGLQLPVGVVLTALAAFGFLFLERFGTRPLELFFGVLILVLALSMGRLLALVSPDVASVVEGLLVPQMPPSAMSQAVGMVGCIIMPHNLFLHSALVQSRVVEPGEEREAISLFAVESSLAIFTSVLINTAVVAVFAKGFYGSPEASSIGLNNAGRYLGERYGDALRIVWGLGLCAAGQSSTMTGAYAGQWVMQGYLQLKVKPWKRAIITRSMALVPTLFVAFYFGGVGGNNGGLDGLNSYLNVLQSLVLPFALVPLLSFASSTTIMGEFALSPAARVTGWLAFALVMAANTYLLVEQVTAAAVPLPLLAAGIAVYVAAVVYVAIAVKL